MEIKAFNYLHSYTFLSEVDTWNRVQGAQFCEILRMNYWVDQRDDSCTCLVMHHRELLPTE